MDRSQARDILESNRDKLDVMADALMKYETIDQGQIADIMAGRQPRPPADISSSDDTSSGTGKSAASRETKASGDTIGGPAGEH